MAASFQAKDSQVLQQQLVVQELTLKANNSLITDDSTDLFIHMGETILTTVMCIKQIAAGTVSGVVATVANDTDGNPTLIKLAGQTGAATTTSFQVKYTTHE